MINRFPREFYIGKAYREATRDDDLGAVVYINPTQLSAMGFGGKRSKPDWHIRFRSAERMAKHITDWLDGLRGRQAMMTDHAAKRKAAARGLEIGDICRCCWGYDQTNVDYYQVTALIGVRMIEARKIGADNVDTGWLTGKSAPLADQFIGRPFRANANDGAFRVGHHYAFKMTPESNVAGVRIYEPSNWTAYA
ncbi:MAG: hypothetical protein ACREEP_11390 [Dongiaceae bacterium]